MNHDTTIEVPFLNLARVTADIAAEGGKVVNMRVETNCYILSVVWPEEPATTVSKP